MPLSDLRTLELVVAAFAAGAFGAALGLVSALLGELAQRVLYAHADTHLDPPAASIVATALPIAALAAVGAPPTAA